MELRQGVVVEMSVNVSMGVGVGGFGFCVPIGWTSGVQSPVERIVRVKERVGLRQRDDNRRARTNGERVLRVESPLRRGAR